MTTKDTADAIIHAMQFASVNDNGEAENISSAHILAMAQLWLLLPDLQDAVTECLNEAQNASLVKETRVRYYTDLLTKLNDLEGK